MRRALFLATLAVLLLAGGLVFGGGSPVLGASTVFVDGTPGDPCSEAFPSVTTPYTTIQQGVDAAAPGDTVHVCNGQYPESVLIQKSLVLEGDVDTLVTTPGPVTADLNIITVAGAASVEIRNLVVGFPDDAAVQANAPRQNGINFRGIVYQNASGHVHDVNVARVRGALFEQNGTLFMPSGDSRSIVVTGSSNVTISNMVTTEYGNAGITVTGAGAHATIQGNQIEGFGELLPESQFVVQRGIEVSNGASATILGNGLENNWHTGSLPGVAADVALENAAPSTVGGGFTMSDINMIAEAQVGLYRCGANFMSHSIGFNFFVLNGQDQVAQPSC